MEATYYLRAQLPTPEAAASVLDDFKCALVTLHVLNERRWAIQRLPDASCRERRAALALVFRDIDGMVPWQEIAKACGSREPDPSMNCCGGLLPDITDKPRVALAGAEIRLSDTVWHFTKWDGIAAWLEAKGAVNVEWMSDDYCEPWWNDRTS